MHSYSKILQGRLKFPSGCLLPPLNFSWRKPLLTFWCMSFYTLLCIFRQDAVPWCAYNRDLDLCLASLRSTEYSLQTWWMFHSGSYLLRKGREKRWDLRELRGWRYADHIPAGKLTEFVLLVFNDTRHCGPPVMSVAYSSWVFVASRMTHNQRVSSVLLGECRSPSLQPLNLKDGDTEGRVFLALDELTSLLVSSHLLGDVMTTSLFASGGHGRDNMK